MYLYILLKNLYVYTIYIYIQTCPQKSGVPAPIKHIGFKRYARLYLEKINLMRAKCSISCQVLQIHILPWGKRPSMMLNS